MYTPELGIAIEDLDTPCLLVDLDVMERNISTMMQSAQSLGINVRPHLKTVKSPGLARQLIEQGAVGGCVAKLSEAEVMIEAGVDDLLITTEIVGEPKISRLVSLATRTAKLKIVLDSEIAAQQTNERMSHVGHPLQVLIDLNVGQNRCGVENAEAALSLAQTISTCKNLQLIGVQGYEGHLQMMGTEDDRRRLCHESMHKLIDTAEKLKKAGFNIETVTTGGTGTYKYCAEIDGVTEVQPGSFVFMDLAYARSGKRDFNHALFVLSTVISKPLPTRAVIDAGMKSLSTDSGNAELFEHSTKLLYRPGGDEHGILEPDNGSAEVSVSIGQKLKLIPSHIDTTVNLHDNYYCVRNGKLEAIWRISARGKVQ
jgi:D-serine deaminase-like pyridoxal phosphate-dependent protein